ncbi:MAG: type II secretion system protein GspL [Gammaproteobacteria bacterium]|nr:MAG: type II secretion system protein GspL [Gammaproteobacteria bacterium]
MNQGVVVRLLDEIAGRYQWVFSDAINSFSTDVHTGDLNAFVSAAQGREVIFIVPGADVMVASAVVPSRNRQKIRQAVPYMIEDNLAEDINNMHFAVSEQDRKGHVQVAVISSHLMDDWSAQMNNSGLHVTQAIPEIFLLPRTPGTWSMLVENDNKVVLRYAEYGGLVFSAGNAGFILKRLLNEQHDSLPAELHIINTTGNKLDLDSVQTEFNLTITEETTDEDPLSIFCRGLARYSGINLLQGKYSPGVKMAGKRYWWFGAVAALLAWLILNTGLLLYENNRLESHRDRINDEIKAAYRGAFPNAQKIPQPVKQMERELTKLRTAGSKREFVELLAITGRVVQSASGANLDVISYRGGRLSVELKLENIQVLDELKVSFRKYPYVDMKIQQASASGNLVVAKLQVEYRK